MSEPKATKAIEAPSQGKIASKRLTFSTGIRSIFEDSQGNIWFGSHQEGVGLFDGEEFRYFTTEEGLSHNQVRNIYEDKNGTIWFECGKGVSSFDGEKISTPTDINHDSKNEWQPNDNDLWFKGNEMVGYNSAEGGPGVYQLVGEKLSFHTFPNVPNTSGENYYSITTPFIKSKNGGIWFGTYGAAIRYDGSDFFLIDNELLGRNEEMGFLHIRSLMEDSQGKLWIGNNGIGVFTYDGTEAIHFTKQQKATKEDTQGPSLERVFSIAEDNEGNIWFGTIKSGVLEIRWQSAHKLC